jgi:peroxiredoxin
MGSPVTLASRLSAISTRITIVRVAYLCLLSLLLFASGAMSQESSHQVTPRLPGVADDAKFEYRDEKGAVLSEKEFYQRLGPGGFNMKKAKDGKTVTLMLPEKERDLAKLFKEMELKAGTAIPEFSLRTLDGKTLTRESLLGHETLLSFFFAECGPCIAEVPALNAYQAKNPGRQVLAVTFDDADTAGDFVKQRKLNWSVATDAQKFMDAVGVKTFPTLVLVGPDGRVKRSSQTAASGPHGLASLEAWIRGN